MDGSKRTASTEYTEAHTRDEGNRGLARFSHLSFLSYHFTRLIGLLTEHGGTELVGSTVVPYRHRLMTG